MTNPLLLYLEERDRLSPEEREIILAMSARERRFEAKADIVKEGAVPSESCLMLSGYSVRYHILEDGRRQISAIHLPGDFVDLHSLLLKQMDHGVAALTDCRVALVPHRLLRDITENQPHLARMLWLSTLIDAAIHRRWLVTAGRLTATGQLSHLLCEIWTRLEVVKLTDADSFDFPISQMELGDTLGLSTVHVNRTIRELRERNLVQWQGGRMTILDKEGLRRTAQFEPAYLNLQQRPR